MKITRNEIARMLNEMVKVVDESRDIDDCEDNAISFHITPMMSYAVYWDDNGKLQTISNTDNL